MLFFSVLKLIYQRDFLPEFVPDEFLFFPEAAEFFFPDFLLDELLFFPELLPVEPAELPPVLFLLLLPELFVLSELPEFLFLEF